MLNVVAIGFQTLLVWQIAAWVTVVFETAPHTFLISSLSVGSVVGFLQYTTSSVVPLTRVTHLLKKASYYFFPLKCMYIF